MRDQDHETTSSRKCLRCFLVHEHCLCDEIPSLRNRTGLLVLQHPKERFHPIGTARIARLGLANCEVLVARDHTNESLTVDPGSTLVDGTALLFPDPAAPYLDELAPDERPQALCVLDGTWAQAKRLFHENPWVRELPRIRFTPTRESEYRIRREPHPHFVSTIEAIVAALRILEPELEHTESLLDAFRSMVARQEKFGRSPDRKPRHQRPRNRPSRVIPTELLDDELVLLAIDTWTQDPEDPTPRALHVAMQPIDPRRESFEAILRPDDRSRDPEADRRKLSHAELSAEDVESGCSQKEFRNRLAEFLRGRPRLAAWNQRTLSTLDSLLASPLPSTCLKAAYTNLRGGRIGGLIDVLAREQLEPCDLPFRGRIARRLGEALAVTHFLRDELASSSGITSGEDPTSASPTDTLGRS
ncbi:MAG: tRNA-uridine aminocarboxypropyltransferase [Planctomycetota bacterium]